MTLITGTLLIPPAESPAAERALWPAAKAALLPVAGRVFWWGRPEDWLRNPPAGVLDIKSWNYWHNRFHLETPPLPARRLP